MKSETAWYINTWVGRNCPSILYIILSIAILLQQFPVTEPLVFGFWWITILSFFGGALLSSVYYLSDPRTIYIQAAVALAGVMLQIYLVTFHWDQLVWLDNALHLLRGMLINTILCRPNNPASALWWFHLVPGWLIWGSLTYYALKRVAVDGCIFFSIRKRAW